MADLSEKSSRRQRFLKPFQSGYDKIVNLTKSPSRPLTPLPGGSAAPSTNDGSMLPAIPSALDSQTTADSQKAQSVNVHEMATRLTRSDVGPASIVDYSTPGTKSGSDIAERFTGTGSLAFSGLESALRILAKSAGALPPLKQAFDAFIACLDVIQAKHVEDYQRLTSQLTKMAETLSQYMAELSPEDSNGTAERIARSVEAEVARINERRSRSIGRRVVQASEDKDDVIGSYRKIEALFQELQSDMSLRTWKNTNKLPLHYAMSLLQGMSPVDDAMYNSSYSTTVKRRGCTPETRQKVQADIQDWIQDPNGAKIYWMNGMAGTGKTTIAYSVCEWLEASQMLGASFFCSRVSSSCRNVNWIMPTIAYQLALASQSFQLALCKVLETNPSISKQNVVQQFEKLIRRPLTANRSSDARILVVVIDALDECEDDYGVRLVLGTLLKSGTELPLKFLIASRPEPAIQENMLSPTGYSPNMLHLHDIEQSVVEEDIVKYLNEALGTMAPPPSSEQIGRLAKLAGKLFIYAATTARYITSGGGYAITRLNSMLALEPQSTVNRPSSKRYKELDELYTAVLSSALDSDKLEAEEKGAMQMVLWTVICAKEPMTVPTLGLFINLTETQVVAALDPLHSVLHVSEDHKLVSTLHASFPDYVLDRHRSKGYYCDQGEHHGVLANRGFDTMKEQLKFNICDLESSFTFDQDVQDLEQRVKTNISPVLFYACQHWGHHLRLASTSPFDGLCKKLAEFLDVRMLFWMEVMNLKRCIATGSTVLAEAEAWLLAANANSDHLKQTTDARDFVARFAACACSRSTPHIYLSALPFCARTSSVYKQHWMRAKSLMKVSGTAISQRDRAARATWKTNLPIISAAFSPDGARIVSGSGVNILVWDVRTGDIVAGPFEQCTRSVMSVGFSPDNQCVVSASADEIIRIWNARTGDIVAGPFQGHTNSIRSVAFSPDGARIVSGSDDQTIRVWDVRTGNGIAGPLLINGHTDWVRSVAFSPEGARIVSGSDDQTVRVWDSRTGDVVAGPFGGHTSYVTSVAFSPDGTRVVSGSLDKTIRIWCIHTGDTVAGPFEGHTEGVRSVGFSYDGARVVSGSDDATVRVWNSQTGDTVAGPFMGHTSGVDSVAFSPDATQIVSGSDDCTLRVWDAYPTDACTTSVALCKPVEAGHSHSIASVAFSPDGALIASGSYDRTIRLWDAHSGNAIAISFEGHTDYIRSVAFSPDSARIVSGSDDQTIRVWDARTGNIIAGPFEGHVDYVMSVAFSPDGTSIASGSIDKTIRLWDACSGDVVAGPLKGHTDFVRSTVFSPDSARVASGSDDRTVRVWDARTGDLVAGPFGGHTDYIRSVMFSPDGGRIVSGSDDRTIRVWDVRTGDVVAGPFELHSDAVNSVAFSPDGAYIVSGSDDRTVVVSDALTGRVVAGPFKGHTGSVNSVECSPDGMSIVSGSSDQAIRIFRMNPSHPNPELHRQLLRHRMVSYTDVSDSSSNVNVGDPPNDNTTPTSDICRPGTIVDFECHDDGWVTSNGVPLFWTPPDLRSHIPYPQDRLVIGHQGSLLIDYQHALFGERWTECYSSL